MRRPLATLAGLVSLAFFLFLPGASGEETGGSLPLVVIDPGHGGKDRGAVSADGVREKDLSLAIALKVQDECRRRGMVRVVLTRATDKYLDGLARVGLANAEKAQAFVSLHFDASFSPFARGTSAFYCAGVAGSADSGSFRRWESVAAAHAASSRRLALILAESLGGSEENLGESDAPCLQGLDMPAALVEIAFLTYELELGIVQEEAESISLRIVDALEAFLGVTGEEVE